MSFSGTPLGQGRRLDHNTFLGKPPSTGAVPPSYAYGAPTLGSRSPPKPTSPSRDGGRHPDEENEPALARFARLKQRESALDPAHRPGAPKIITSPNPEHWSVKDTSVKIATAFSQAANGDMSASYNHNNSWASTSRTNVVPRSTSVEYEASAPTTINRKLAPPPDRFNRNPNGVRKPLSKTTSIRHVPDSEGEEDSVGANGRGKSPFEQGVNFAKQALSAAAFYVRQRSHEPEETSGEQRSVNGTNNGNDSSYDYAAEETAFQSQKKTAAAHKRNRMSTDNKAYKPSASSEEESELSEGGKTKRRRRKMKKGPLGGPLTSLPTFGADKRRKKKGRASKGNIGGPEGEESESEEDNTQVENQSQTSQQRNSVLRTTNPPQSRASVSRLSQEPSLQHDPDDSLLSAEQGLHSIPEVEEELLTAEPVRASSQQRRGRSRTPAPYAQPSAPFSIGGLLGRIVHVVIKLFVWFFSGMLSFLSMLTFLFGQVFGTTFDVILRRPAAWARGAGPLLKYLVPGLVLVASWYALQSIPIASYIPELSFPSRSPTYQSPGVPPVDIADFSERLLRVEKVLTGLSATTEQVKARSEDGDKNFSKLRSLLKSLEDRLEVETNKVRDAEAKSRDAVRKSINGVKHDVEILQAQLTAQQKQDQKTPGDITDEEARAKLNALEKRVGGVEGDVKEALELGKKVATAPPPAAAPTVPGAAWWNKLATGAGSKTGLQIKSSDGQDVTALISHLVDNAVTRVGKDGIAKADYAMHSGGARVVPSLTSPTLEIKPNGFTAQVMSLFTGSGSAIGRMPVVALHPDSHNGLCWPFAGQQGQLGVALAAPVFVEEVTVDHLSKDVAYDMRSAPREMEVWGMVEGKDNIGRLKAWKDERATRKEMGQVDEYESVVYPKTLPNHPEYIRLANFTYDIHAPQYVQTFPVDPEIKALGIDFGIVALRVLNNWGRDEYTCLYRFRVHGQRIGEIPEPYSGRVEDGSDASS
ncbi:unnamed protein product [Cyclocybe aegerita]|uniref:SUN domain-containing protein n=1 Tax=Cyclocybe aegerita TaxID=1973307 RepID=A0A8S0W1W4_CYCAE|nr:unnamed protein product [Cyclocybe aegerita]